MSRADDAREILANPLFSTLIQELELMAVNQIVAAPYNDHEARQARAADIRAVRNLRSRVEAIAEEGVEIVRKAAPA